MGERKRAVWAFDKASPEFNAAVQDALDSIRATCGGDPDRCARLTDILVNHMTRDTPFRWGELDVLDRAECALALIGGYRPARVQ